MNETLKPHNYIGTWMLDAIDEATDELRVVLARVDSKDTVRTAYLENVLDELNDLRGVIWDRIEKWNTQ